MSGAKRFFDYGPRTRRSRRRPRSGQTVAEPPDSLLSPVSCFLFPDLCLPPCLRENHRVFHVTAGSAIPPYRVKITGRMPVARFTSRPARRLGWSRSGG